MKKADLAGGYPDAYVQVLLNTQHKEIKTKIVKNSANPSWQEEFRFETPLAEVNRNVLGSVLLSTVLCRCRPRQ